MNCVGQISRQTILPVRFIEEEGFGFTVYDDGTLRSWRLRPSEFMELYRRASQLLDKTLDGDSLTFADGAVGLEVDDQECVWLVLDRPGLRYRVSVTRGFLDGLLDDMDAKTDAGPATEEAGE